ncbi:ornithine carbamoyltransferase [Candidatus Micrarchaeota archaeon]|nr:MAG: ornithine carbamoyltransferase [Candidatus Micrarchaeota archaeon]
MNFLSITDINVSKVLSLAKAVKENPPTYAHALKHKALAAIFEKSSTRTKLSFQLAVLQMGGYYIELGGAHLLNGHEDAHDTANSIAQYADFLLARVNSHSSLEALAAHSPIPVINALSNLEHPCQALADLLTISESKGLHKTKLAYIGDSNNVSNSLLLACALTGLEIAIASPANYGPSKSIIKKASEVANNGFTVNRTNKPPEAAADADVVYTDAWVSMGQENEAEQKLKAFKGFQITQELMECAKPDAIFMHCLPAHKGLEVAPDVIEGPQSAVFQQAANRLHVQKAVLLMLSNPKPGVNA